MAGWIPDDMDFTMYAREERARAKVRKASEFKDDLVAEFSKRDRPPRSVMRSTKMRGVIEFREQEVTVWAGYNGHRKSTLTGQVALDLCSIGERTMIMSLEMPPVKTLARMNRQACALASPTQSDIDLFSRWTDGRLWLFDHIGNLTPELCISACNYFAQELGGRHVFIDSMMKVCESEKDLDIQKRFLNNICALAEETGLHIHLIAHCRKASAEDDNKLPNKYDIRGSASISDLAHNVALVWMNREKKQKKELGQLDDKMLAQPDAVVVVDKQRNGSWEGKLNMWFDDPSMRFCDDRTSPVEPYPMEIA